MIRAICVCPKCRTWTLAQVPRVRAETWFYCPICRERVPAKSACRSNIPAEPQEIAAR